MLLPDPCLIACLDVTRGRPLDPCGIDGLANADAVTICRHHEAEGATMLYLDVDDGWEEEVSFIPLVEQIADAIRVPLVVMVRSGTIARADDVKRLMAAGASCVAINTSAVERPALVDEIVAACGSGSLLGVISAEYRGPGRWEPMIRAGTRRSGLDAVAWAQELAARGVFAIVINARDREGRAHGYDLALVRAIVDAAGIPVIASGGAGTGAHLVDAVRTSGARGVLGNSMFHSGRCRVRDARRALGEVSA